MRQIGTIPDQQQARLFEDHLLTLGVKAMVEEEADGWTAWIYDEDDVERAKQALAAFLKAPDDAVYRNANTTAEELRNKEQKQNANARKNQIDVRERWSRPAAQSCPVTFAMIAISVVVGVLSTDSTPSDRSLFPFRVGDKTEPVLTYLHIAPVYDAGEGRVRYSDLEFEAVRRGQAWRLVTPIFIHFGILHLAFNMIWLRQLGAIIEFLRGSLRFALLAAVIAIASNGAQYLHHGPAFGGMSGVVFGLFGYIWIKGRCDPNSGFFLHPNTVFWMMAWFFLCMTGSVGAIANMAHGVGLVTGFVLGYAPTLWKNTVR